MGAHAGASVVINRAHFQVHRLEAAKRALDDAQSLVGAHGVSRGRSVLAEDAVDLRTHQQLEVRGVLAAFDEQVEEVGLAVHGADHARLRQALGRLGAVAQPLNPTKRLPVLARLGAFVIGVGGRGRVEPGPQHPQRHPVGLTARVVCRYRPRASAPVWFEPITPNPCV